MKSLSLSRSINARSRTVNDGFASFAIRVRRMVSMSKISNSPWPCWRLNSGKISAMLTTKRWSAGLLLLILLFPVLVNHDAYRSYFDDDDLGSLNWARIVPLKSYIVDLPCLRYPCAHNRPLHFHPVPNSAHG